MAKRYTPTTLARIVVARMTAAEKIGEIVLRAQGRFENVNSGAPRLCIPRLTLLDGPAGLAYDDTGVTQLPSPLGLAATFDISLAKTYGQVQGAESRGQGIDVLQGPNLNVDRVPESGRAFEGYGEDPLLVSAMGVADIQGIQSQGVMADAKHLVAYNQEADRGVLDAVVSERALQEIYLKPFRAAVSSAHVASLMCAYPMLNGVFQCEDPALASTLSSWGFSGFVRSDLGAVHDPVAAIESGTDLIKPANPNVLLTDVEDGVLPIGAVDTAVTRVLTSMFAWGLVGRPATGGPGTPVDTTPHADVALQVAERSAVLLKDARGVLPFDASTLGSLAVIGADAASAPVTRGYGSSAVNAPFVSTPLAAIEKQTGTKVHVTWADGGSSIWALPPVPTSDLAPASGVGQGLTLTVTERADSPPEGVPPTKTLRTTVPGAAAILYIPRVSGTAPARAPGSSATGHPAGAPAQPPVERPRPNGGDQSPPARTGGDQSPPARTGAGAGPPATATLVVPNGTSSVSATFTGTVTPPSSGLYSISVTGAGAATLSLDGKPVVSNPYDHGWEAWSQAIPLVGGHHYRLLLRWTPWGPTLGGSGLTPGRSGIVLGWQNESAAISEAVAAARSSQTAVVFAGDFSTEGADRPSLSLPGDQNALISAVAAANPRTVVVLNTGGPVLMPWLSKVAGVIEAWYPGEQDGAAIAQLLFGAADPSGHLPVTFPVSQSASPIHAMSQWPGTNLVSTYSEGLDVGYRYYNATGTTPLFPFGFGLSYTTFSMSGITASRSRDGYRVSLTVTNTGGREGVALPQVYLTFPRNAGEPPGQLAAFEPIDLRPGQSSTVKLDVSRSSFSVYRSGAWATVAGTYVLAAGFSSASTPLHLEVQAP
jgi:beta-glucosidase